jgi:hypothetical protein
LSPAKEVIVAVAKIRERGCRASDQVSDAVGYQEQWIVIADEVYVPELDPARAADWSICSSTVGL